MIECRRLRVAALALGMSGATAVGAAEAGALADLLADVTAAEAHKYGLKDDRGRSMDCLKVFQTGPGRYMGIYHTMEKGVFSLHLARSGDLLAWQHVRALDTHASQGTIWRAPRGACLVAYEKDAPNSCWIRLRLYKDLLKLAGGAYHKQRDLARSLAPTAEGTPSVESVEWDAKSPAPSRVCLRLHFFQNARVDQLARGTLTDFTTWKARPSTGANAALIRLGAKGNLGDRDRFTWQGKVFYLQEAQWRRGDWSSWRVVLCDAKGLPLTQLAVRTHAGSKAHCNPNVTWVTDPKGRQRLVVTLFTPSEGSRGGEAGSLLYVLDPARARRSKP